VTAWTAVVIAPGHAEDGMRSRLPTVLHPLAGRPLCWHTLSAISRLDRPPDRLLLVAGDDVPADVYRDIPLEVVTVDGAAWKDEVDTPEVMIVMMTAAALHHGLRCLLSAGPGKRLADADGDVIAALMPIAGAPDSLEDVEGAAPLADLLDGLQEPPDAADCAMEIFRVRDRSTLARANGILRDRLVQRLMRSGVTVMLPETVLVEVDVRVGRDSVIYPGAVLEGETTVGEETVIGPGCRLINSQIGTGVELKGWNYISNTSVRNRAILEPYVRRGYD
jgi:hypothetical protein